MSILRTPVGQARRYRPTTSMGDILRTPSGQARSYRPATSMGAVDMNGNIVADPVIAPAGAPVPGNCGAGAVYSSFYGNCVNACPPGQGLNASGICTPFGSQGMSTTTYLLIGGGLLAAYLFFVR
ncbi:MAG TPA: hypothetical protein VGM94_00955 [Galbitalea sp.]|jgi:hypothetical protein